MIVDARERRYEHIEIFGKSALFTNLRIYGSVPEALYCYDLRGSDYDASNPLTIEPKVMVNYAGTVLVLSKIDIPEKQGFLKLENGLNFLGEELTMEEFCKKYDIVLQSDIQDMDIVEQNIPEHGMEMK
ncbi:hypothetical protein KQI41_10735 [Tissierella pigra]|uniref:Large polyvalent protein associated domain-containing protein n=1 Tax=Tissierella pigra TaxID=2607614 RepID=A0A6N7Y3Y4_9FIRM|nr:LPD28 domain-containing protein [Tissierella pigra]MBU5426886.1 hypothetical protein [Tissierella pigra]MSU03485.1 hypothetical protein [Tissierella pigra]